MALVRYKFVYIANPVLRVSLAVRHLMSNKRECNIFLSYHQIWLKIFMRGVPSGVCSFKI